MEYITQAIVIVGAISAVLLLSSWVWLAIRVMFYIEPNWIDDCFDRVGLNIQPSFSQGLFIGFCGTVCSYYLF